MKTRKIILVTALVMGVTALTSCGGSHQEKTEDVVGTELYTKIIEWVDKENGLPYYKYGLSKKNGSVYIEGKAFEVTAFSAEPSYEGLIVSLYGLMEVSK